MADIPMLTDAAIVKLGTLVLRSDQLVDAVFFGDFTRIDRAVRNVRALLADNEIMALKYSLDRQGLLPEKER